MHDQEIDIVGWPGQDFVPGARLSSSGDYEFIYETVEPAGDRPQIRSKQ